MRYEVVNVKLLNEFLKAHRKMEEREATIMHLQKQIEALLARLHSVQEIYVLTLLAVASQAVSQC
jgi:Tfp pilus assembly protein PilN